MAQGFLVSNNKSFMIENSSKRDDIFLFVVLSVLTRIREEIDGQNQNKSVFQHIFTYPGEQSYAAPIL